MKYVVLTLVIAAAVGWVAGTAGFWWWLSHIDGQEEAWLPVSM